MVRRGRQLQSCETVERYERREKCEGSAKVYLLDMDKQPTYRKGGPEERLLTMTEQALSEFLAVRR